MGDRCDLTELLKDQCAHCLGHADLPTTPSTAFPDGLDEDVEFVRTFTARFDSRCGITGEHSIRRGDEIALTESHGYICARCTQEASS